MQPTALPSPLAPTHYWSAGSTRYAFGLTWRVLPGLKDQTPASEARQLASNMKASYGAILQTPTRTLVGLATGRPARAISAAAILAATATRRLVIIPLSETATWVCLIEDSGLPTDTDVVLEPAQASRLVQSLMTDAAAKSKSTPIFCTPDTALSTPWIEDATRAPVETLLASVNESAARVVKLDTWSTRARVYVTLAVLVPAALGYHQWTQYQHRQAAARAELEAAALARQQDVDLATATALREAAIDAAVANALAAETSTPPTIDALATCLTHVRQIGRVVGGWRVLTIRCEPLSGLLSATLVIDHPSTPTYGTPATLSAAAEALGASTSVTTSLRDATLTLQIPREAAREPVHAVDALPRLIDITQNATPLLRRARGRGNYQFSISPPSPRTFSIPDPAGIAADGSQPQLEIPAERSFSEGVIRIDTPSAELGLLTAIDGAHLRPVSLESNPATRQLVLTLSYLVKP